jgi:hypothetical protein
MANVDNANASQDQIHSADHKADPKPSSSSGASVQEYQDFEATTAVLDTNELLHMIIAEVPLKYRPSIRGVSTIWQAAVTKVGYTLEPSVYQPPNLRVPTASTMNFQNFLTPQFQFPLGRKRFNQAGLPDLPMVSSDAIFDTNPVFPEEEDFGHGRSSTDSRYQEFLVEYGTGPSVGRPHDGSRGYYRRYTPAVSEIVGIEQQFITNPPLTQVFMSARHGELAAILRVHEGIRLGDLVGYAKRMLPNRPNPRISWSFGREGNEKLTGGYYR